MEPTANQTTDIYHWVAWAHARRKQLALGVLVAAAAGFGIWLYIWMGFHRETVASEALSNLKAPPQVAGAPRTPVPPATYLLVANEHPGTKAGARALLLAAGASFELGKFKDAQVQFEKFLADYPDSSWKVQAQLGVAASLEGQGNTAEALTRYKQFVDTHPQDPGLPQAKSALARLYLAQNKPDLALKLYQELVREQHNDSWTMEASVFAQELLAAHPELRPKPAPEVEAVSAALNKAVPGAMVNLTAAPPAMVSPPPGAAKPSPAQTALGTNATQPK